ncbi:MAG: leucyl aminopeptidase [Immundisolibacteraceae bacterium]|nr:leucyl aminopeptidase [Immundisolibacteraceae bacterium]
MKFSLATKLATEDNTHCLVVPVVSGKQLPDVTQQVDQASGGAITAAIKAGDASTSHGKTLLLRSLAGIKSDRVLLVGCGKPGELTATQYVDILRAVGKAVKSLGAASATCHLNDLEVAGQNNHWKLAMAVQTLAHCNYRFDELKSAKSSPAKLKRIALGMADTSAAAAKQARTTITTHSAIAEGVKLARDLGNRPGNVCTPVYLADQAKQVAAELDLIIDVLDESRMDKLGMNSLLSVGRGSREESRLIVLEYRGTDKKVAPTVLVGKGVTFDAGGISLKPAGGMEEMKYDMCGAASVLGTLKAAATAKLPVNVIGIIPAVENMPDGLANKPGDVVTSMSGKTIEIINTDAEGRLILADALTYAERYNPAVVIDIATLTGACIIALGNHLSAVIGNDQPLVDELIQAGLDSHDRCWQLPMMDEYQRQIKSNIADISNVGGRQAGTVTAACFLSRFTEKQRWAHLDIAGTAWQTGKNKDSTGRPVPQLTQFLINSATG